MPLKLPRLGLKILLQTFFLLSLLLLLFSSGYSSANAGKCNDYYSCNEEIERVKKEIARLQGLENSLENQIAYLDNQIYLTQLEIKAKGEEIKILSGDISELSERLDRIDAFLDYQEDIFAARARSAYTSNQLSPFDIVLAADELDDALRKIKYLRVLEEQDRLTLEEMNETRDSFKEQKTTLANKRADAEQLKVEVEQQKQNLISQQGSKENILEETNGKEANYQQLLKFLQAEMNSILAALAGGGTKIGKVSVNGQWVRLSNQGSTGCSTGAHVHYAVGKGPVGNSTIYGNSFVSPFGYPANLWMSGSTVRSGSYRSPGGPLNALTVGRGYSSSHRAIDVVSKSGWNGSFYGVYASRSGTAYLVRDTNWYSWCREYFLSRGWPVKPYDGPAYGIVIDHHNGWKTLYWHVSP